MIYLILAISSLLFFLSFEKTFINTGDLILNEAQKSKLIMAFKPFIQILALTLLFLGISVEKLWGKDAAGFFTGFYPLLFFSAGLYFLPYYLSVKHTKLTILSLILLVGLSIPLVVLFLNEVKK